MDEFCGKLDTGELQDGENIELSVGKRQKKIIQLLKLATKLKI